MPHLFEFTDQSWVPSSARATFFEILDLCNSRFRDYNASVANKAVEIAAEQGADTIVELGAGRAPITRHLAADPRTDGLTLVPCDLKPHAHLYRELEAAHPDKVSPIYESVDFSQPLRWDAGALLIFCAALHHVPSKQRPAILAALAEGDAAVAVFEPMRCSLPSIVSVFGAIAPALLLPVLGGTSGLVRRIFWCWLFPAVPAMFIWDAVVSCLRQWSDQQWRRQLEEVLGSSRTFTILSGWHSQIVTWAARTGAAAG